MSGHMRPVARLNYPSPPITFPCFNSRGVYIFKCSRPENAEKLLAGRLIPINQCS
jgi:hypothetical protein